MEEKETVVIDDVEYALEDLNDNFIYKMGPGWQIANAFIVKLIEKIVDLDHKNSLLTENIDCSNVSISDQVLDGGRKARRSIIFNNYQFEVSEGEKIALKLDLYNSFDGSWPWFSAFGALNFVCMNQVFS